MSDTDPQNDRSKAAHDGDRIAKVIARAGLASRRDAEAMIAEGRVAVNGKIIESAALNVTEQDRVTVDGTPLAPPERARLWLYHKPAGLVTTARDEQGRETVFDTLPAELPRVMSVGRLDLNSEGLLLLTNDGALKRRLELPSTGWLRRYRVRVRGTPTEAQLAPLRAGMTVDGETFAPMLVTLDRQQGGNAWLTVGLREGRNREIRRAMESQGFLVNRLIRVSYGPFQLGKLASGEIEEVRARVLRDQLGEPGMADDNDAGKKGKDGGRKPARRGAKGEGHGGKARRPGRPGDGAPKGRGGPGKGAAGGGKPGRAAGARDERPSGPRKPWSKDGGGEKSRDFKGRGPKREDGDRPKRFDRDAKPGGPRRDRDEGGKGRGPKREDGGRPKRFDREREERPRNERAEQRAAEKAEREARRKQMLADPGKSLRTDAKGAPKKGSARKGGSKSPGTGLYGSRDLGGRKPPRKP